MAKHRIDVRGVIIPNDYKFFYDYFGDDSTCPRDVQKVILESRPGDDIEVYVSSPGGVIDAGSEIYTMLREASRDRNVQIYITGQACSAASVIACAARCAMAPTALMMVHCVSTYGGGNHNDFEHAAEMLRTADRALCTAYMAKAGMTEEEALDMMEHETWLTAEQAKERGLVDEIMFEEQSPLAMVAGAGFKLPTAEQLDQIRSLTQAEETHEADAAEILQTKLNILKTAPKAPARA